MILDPDTIVPANPIVRNWRPVGLREVVGQRRSNRTLHWVNVDKGQAAELSADRGRIWALKPDSVFHHLERVEIAQARHGTNEAEIESERALQQSENVDECAAIYY